MVHKSMQSERPLAVNEAVNEPAPLDTVLITGYAKAPQGTSMHQLYGHVGIVLEVNPLTDTIVGTEFTFVTDLAKSFLSRLLKGQRLQPDIQQLSDLVKRHYLAPSQQALIVALRVATQRYFDSKHAYFADTDL